MGRVLGAVLIVCAALIAKAPGGEKEKPFQHTKDEAKVFELNNEERKKKDIGTLALNAALSKVARAHSENMARQGKMEHNLDCKTPFDRLRAAEFAFRSAAENIAAGEKGLTLEQVMKAWMESDGHRANILEADFTDAGVGTARDKDGKLYITVMFATPRKK